MIQDKKTIDRYVSDHAGIMAALDNIREFVATMPAPEPDGDSLNMNYPQCNDVARLRKAIEEASEIADGIFGEPDKTIELRVKVETGQPDRDNGTIPYWVARDKRGEWITYGKVDRERTPKEIAKYLFFSDEIVTVEDGGPGEVLIVITR